MIRQRKHLRLWVAIWELVLVLMCQQDLQAGVPIRPVTTGDPNISLEELELRLQPLTEEELKVETEGWMGLLKRKVKELSAAQLAVHFKNVAIEKIEEAQDVAEEVGGGQQSSGSTKEKKEMKMALKEARQAELKAAKDREIRKVTAEALKQAKAKAEEEGEEEPKPSKSGAAVVEQKEDVKAKLLEHINQLRDERTALIKRVEMVLSAWESKGGDADTIEKYRKYISAVSGVKMDVSDTTALWATVKGWILSEQGGIRWAKNLSAFVVTVLAFWYLSKFLGNVTSRAFHVARGGSALLRDFTVKAVRRVVIFIGIIVGLSALEVNIGPLLALIGAVGFVIALALQDSLSNFASGILMLLYRPFDVGDVVEAGGVAGTVTNLTLFSTHIKTFDNKAMIVPNNQVWGGVITNATGTDKRRVDMVFGIGYEDDIDHAQKVLEDIVNSHERVLKDPAPVIKVHELAPLAAGSISSAAHGAVPETTGASTGRLPGR